MPVNVAHVSNCFKWNAVTELVVLKDVHYLGLQYMYVSNALESSVSFTSAISVRTSKLRIRTLAHYIASRFN